MTEKQEETCKTCGYPKGKGYLCNKCHNQKTCENCGHDKMSHTWFTTRPECNITGCSCKKFKAKNHSPVKRKDSIHRVHGAVESSQDTPSGNIELLPRDKQKEGTYASAEAMNSDKEVRKAFNLSEKKVIRIGINVYREEDVKEAIRKLKEYLQKEWELHHFVHPDEIDKIFGKNLSGDL